MSINTLRLVTCPFCPDDLGEIAIDASALAALPDDLRQSGHLSITRDPGQAILIFNSPRAEPGPCEHLLCLTGTCTGRSSKRKGRGRYDLDLTFGWSHAVLPRRQSWEDDIEEYMSWLESGPQMGWFPPRPKTEWCEENLGRAWPATGGSNAKRYSIDGRAVFVADALAFCDEVLKLIPRFQAVVMGTERNAPIDEYYQFIEVELENGGR